MSQTKLEGMYLQMDQLTVAGQVAGFPSAFGRSSHSRRLLLRWEPPQELELAACSAVAAASVEDHAAGRERHAGHGGHEDLEDLEACAAEESRLDPYVVEGQSHLGHCTMEEEQERHTGTQEHHGLVLRVRTLGARHSAAGEGNRTEGRVLADRVRADLDLAGRMSVGLVADFASRTA